MSEPNIEDKGKGSLSSEPTVLTTIWGKSHILPQNKYFSYSKKKKKSEKKIVARCVLSKLKYGLSI